jgi:predicted ATPase with chaperone activity
MSARKQRATVKQIAAMQFTAQRAFRRHSKKERVELTAGLAEKVKLPAVVAVEIIAMTKKELVDHVAGDLEKWGSSLMEFAKAHDDAKALCEIIGTAEARLAVAVATVEGGVTKSAA